MIVDPDDTVATHALTPAAARFEIVDIVRGFALFGVLLANMVWTTQWFAVTDVQRAALATANIDRNVNLFVFLLIDFKFYTLFAALFGLGFAMQLSRAANRGRNVVPVYCRRLAILFVIGIAHALLLWFGDILHVYALVGLVLILFRNTSDRIVLGWAAGLALLTSLMPLLHWIIPTGASDVAGLGDKAEAARFAALTSGSWMRVLGANWTFIHGEYRHLEIGFDSTVYLYLSVLWKFLLGFVVGRRMLLQRSGEHVDQYRRLLPWAAAIGIAGNAYLAVSTYAYDIWLPDSSSPVVLLGWILVEVSMFALSLAYLACLVILFHRPTWRKRIGILAPVGRMALTNYLLQSVFLVSLFYGSGLNLLGKAGTSICLLLSVAIFGFQVAASRWWLARFRFGPMEWVWRCITYGKRQPFRLDTAFARSDRHH